MNQAEYKKQGVVIRRPGILDNTYKFILPPFTHRPIDSLVQNFHYFETLAEIQRAYPTLQSLQEIDSARVDEEAHALQVSMEKKTTQRPRARKKSLAYLEGVESARMFRQHPVVAVHSEMEENSERNCDVNTPSDHNTHLNQDADDNDSANGNEENANVNEDADCHENESKQEQSDSASSDSEDEDEHSDDEDLEAQGGDKQLFRHRSHDLYNPFEEDDGEMKEDNAGLLQECPGLTSQPQVAEILKKISTLEQHFNSSRDDEVEPELYPGKPYIKNQKIRQAKTELEIFFEMFPIGLFRDIARFSNLYKNSKGRSHVKEIKPTEILHFVGLMIAHAVHPWSCGLYRNWELKSKGLFTRGGWGEIMSRNRYKEICSNLHFVNPNSPIPNNNPHYKISYAVNRVNERFQQAYELGKDVSFDEGSIPTKSSYCPAKQCIPEKPYTYHLKLFMLCCAQTGYCSRFELFKGKKDKEKCAGPRAMLRNVKHLAHTNRVVFCDRYYTTMLVVLQLLLLGIYVVGTVRRNVAGFSKRILLPKSKSALKKVARGSSQVQTVVLEDVGFISCISWKDTGAVHMVSTAFAPTSTQIQRRVKGEKEKKTFDCLVPIKQYNDKMGGVDLNDFLRLAIYNVQRKVKFRKWYKMVFAALVDLCITNAFVLWKFKQRKDGHTGRREISHGLFMENLANSLVYFDLEGPSLHTRMKTPRASPTLAHHFVQYEKNKGYGGRDNRAKKCAVCHVHYSTYKCVECDVCLCIRPHESTAISCFEKLHTNPTIMDKVISKAQRKRSRQEEQEASASGTSSRKKRHSSSS